MAAEIRKTHGGDCPIFLGVLSGSFIFMADLVRAYGAACEVVFIRLSSYAGTESTGDLQWHLGLDRDISSRRVIIVEDIVDTGRTLNHLQAVLRDQEPASLDTAAILRKPEASLLPTEVTWVGFDIPDRFVVGYGLDYDGLGRNLAGIYQLAP
jgi:hypoxanthine phosphoribosyltransferase